VDVFYAGKMVERRNGVALRDLTTTETETGSVYVVMPVPESVKKAITPTAQVPSVPLPTVTLAASTTTPRLANGKPDLTGNWGGGGFNWRYGNRRCGPRSERTRDQPDGRFRVRSAAEIRSGPPAQSRALGQGPEARHVDEQGRSVMTCQPLDSAQVRPGASSRPTRTSSSYGQQADGGGGQVNIATCRPTPQAQRTT
jgi:hypothetical protein